MTLPQDVSSRFQILSEVGSGPTGTSYQAQDSQTGRTGLLKVLDAGTGVPAAERQRIKRELGKQTKITSPRLATLFECSTAEPLWLFREHVEGETLQQRLRRGPLPLTAALSITAQIAAALDELHRAGLLHRDLKPGHVVLRATADGSESVTVIDAGIAARIETGTVFDVIGTAAYVSPEQVLGKLVSFRSDLYALGCVLFEMLSGAPPFANEDAKVTLEAHKSAPVPALNASVPPEVSALLTSLLAKEPRSRPFSAQQVRRALEPFLPNTSGPRRSSLPPAPPGQPLRTSPGLPAPVASKPPADDGIEELSADELEAIEPTVVSPAPSALSTSELDPLDLEDEGDAEATEQSGSAAVTSGAEDVNPNATAQMSPVEMEAVVEGSRPVSTATATETAAKAVPSSAERQAIRPAVAFDVETLFDEDAAPASGEADVTRVFRPVPEDAAAALIQDTAAADGDSAPPEAERTVVVANPFGKSGPDKRIVAAVAGVFVILILVSWAALKGDDEPERVAAASTQASAPAAEPTNQATTPSAAARPAPAVAEPVVAEPAVAEPTAAQAEPSAVAANVVPEAAPEATAAAQAAPTAVAEATPTANQAPLGQGGKQVDGEEPERRAARERTAATPRPQAPPPAASGQSADQLRTLARAEFQARRYREAARYYQQAAQKSPSDAGTHAGLGASMLAAGDAKAAISAYQRAIQLSPNQSGFHAALGRAYFQLGDKARAVASYRKAVQLDPNNGVARAALSRLES